MSVRYEKGLKGEEIAEQYLCSLGMTCEARRWRGASGELDLVMRDGETLVAVEVKYRPKARAGAGLFAVTPDKRRRMASAMLAFLYERAANDLPVRFDVV